MKKIILAVLFMVVLVGCGPKAYVECTATLFGMNCSIQRMSGSGDATVCWDVVLTCENGKRTTTNACHPVPPGEMSKVSKSLSWADFKGFDACDKVASSGLENMRLK